MNVCQSLTDSAKIFPERNALRFGEHTLTYRDLNRKSIIAASILVDAGIRPGDRVALMLPNAPSFAVWYYAALRIGAIVVSVSTRLAAGEVEYIANDCGASALVTGPGTPHAVVDGLPDCVRVRIVADDVTGESTDWKRAETANSVAGESCYDATPDEPALILYTSGTTGFPKGATLSHANVRSNVYAFNHLCNMQPDDVVLLAVPLFHCFGQNALLNSLLNVGATIVLQQRFDLNESKRLIAEQKVTQLYGVPMMFGLLLNSCSPSDLQSVNYCFSAAAKLPVQTSHAWREKFAMPIYEGYGLTETSPFATYNHRVRFVPGSIGTPVDSVEIKVVDTETALPCAVGEPGEIAIRGPNVMLGYWNRPDETAAAIRDGWFYSGDIGQLDEDGFLYIVDRVKDMISIGGLKVFPAEVERILLDHPAVAGAAVIGLPDPVFGEQVAGYLVLQDGVDRSAALTEIQKHAAANLGNYKIPRRLAVIDELPRNASGKILKTVLREMAAESFPNDAEPASVGTSVVSTDLASLKPATLFRQLDVAHPSEKSRIAVKFLLGLVKEVCQPDVDPLPEDSFVQAGLDSLAMVSLSSQLQVEAGSGHELPPTLLFDYPRISDMADFLVGLSENSGPEKPTGVKHSPSSGVPDPHSGVGRESMIPETTSFVSSQTGESQPERVTGIQQMTEEQALAELMKELD